MKADAEALLVPPGSSAALVEAITEVLESPKLAAELAAAASMRYQRQFTAAAMASAYRAVYSAR